MREHTQFRVHSTVGNTTMTVVLRPEKRRRIYGQKERESCCFVCSLSFRGCGVNECNEKMRSVFPSQIVLHFQMGNDKSNPLQKDKHEPVSRKEVGFLFLCHTGRQCHVRVSNGGKRKTSVKVTFSNQNRPYIYKIFLKHSKLGES